MSRYDIITSNALWIEALNSDGDDWTRTEVKVVDRVNQWGEKPGLRRDRGKRIVMQISDCRGVINLS